MVINLNKKGRGNVGETLVPLKKAQVKIQQMAFMLIAVFIFFALIGMILLNLKLSGLKQDATELQEKNARLLVSRLADSPEFSCEDSFGSDMKSCIDTDKVMILSENIGKYEDFWGVSSIEIRKIYPISNQDIICDRENYPNCNIIEVLPGEGTYYSNFVVLCRKDTFGQEIYTKCDLGKIMVSYKNVE